MPSIRSLALAACAITSLSGVPFGGALAAELSDGQLRIGVLTDMSGPFSENTGKGSVVAVEMAVEDFGGEMGGKPITVISGDHQNKPDLASATAREWFDVQGVDMIADLINTAVSLAVMEVAREKERVTMVSSGSTRISGENCTPYNVQAVYNTSATGNAVATALLEQGKKKWFFITADYAFGHSTQDGVTKLIEAAGGEVVGSVAHPVGAADFSSFLLTAQASGADVIAFANAGQDFVNAVKQAQEFGVTADQSIVGLASAINDVHGLGLDAAKGLYLSEGFYWDQSDQSRAFAKRFLEKMGKMPNMAQAGLYSATMAYLNAVKETGTDDAATVLASMRGMPIDDGFTGHGKLRETGLLVHDMHLLQAKSPEESSGEWDLLKIVKTIPGDVAFGEADIAACGTAK